MRYRFVLWDFDGTLADSLSVSLNIFNQLARDWGFKPIVDTQRIRKMSVQRFLKEHQISLLQLPGITRAFHQAQRQQIDQVKLYPGIARVLRQLRGSGLRHGVLSSNSPENIQLCFRANGVADLFDFTAGCFKLLGKARGIKHAIKLQRLYKRDVLYVGDELRDVNAAHKAGIAVAAVGWGINDWETLARAEPTHQVATPEELIAIAHVRPHAPQPIG